MLPLSVAMALTVGSATAQQLVRDPRFKDSTAWTVLPGTTATWTTSGLRYDLKGDQAYPMVGVEQVVTIPKDGAWVIDIGGAVAPVMFPQAWIEARLWRVSDNALVGAAKLNCETTLPDRVSGVAMTVAGAHRLQIVSRNTPTTQVAWPTRAEIDAASLPLVTWDMREAQENEYSSLIATTITSPGADAAWALYSYRRIAPLSIPGILGQLELDPAALVVFPAGRHVLVFGTNYGACRINAQVLEVVVSRTWRLGSWTFGLRG